MSTPIVNYRFNTLHYITEFITPHNPDIEEIVAGFNNAEGDDLVERVAQHIRDNYEYPFDSAGNPSCDGQIVRYRKNLFPPNYRWRCCKLYVWAFPNEVVQSGLGYCAESGNLAESLLIHKLDAWATLGDVLDLDDRLLGRHEWVEVPYKGETYIMETTIHENNANNLIKASSIYDKESDWAKQGNLYYSAKGWFNNKEYKGDNILAITMNLPAKRLLLNGLMKTNKLKEKQLNKELRHECKIMETLLKQAWKVY